MRDLSDAELAQLIDKDIFHHISTAADKLGLECYVVGGYVRDLFWNVRQMTLMSLLLGVVFRLQVN